MFQNRWNYLVAVVQFPCLVTVVVGAVVAVVVFWPQFVFSSMTAWLQEMSRLKIAVGAW